MTACSFLHQNYSGFLLRHLYFELGLYYAKLHSDCSAKAKRHEDAFM